MLVGRTAETAAIDRLLAAAREGRSGVVVLRGEAGLGKSALLEHAREQADAFTVLSGVGVEFESELAYAALHQILLPVFDRIDLLPPPQAAALRAAFALSDETVVERFRVSLGVLGLLSEVAEERPLLCLVDDAQWLDQASADALRFTARRLTAEPLVMLFAARDDPSSDFQAPGLPELRPTTLAPEDARALVADRLGPDVTPNVLDWLLTSADGNPLALIELPTCLTSRQLAGDEPLDGSLTLTTSVEQTYVERIVRLPSHVQDLLLLAACEETGDRATIARASALLGLGAEGLAIAEEQGLVKVGRERIEFRHPLVRSAVYRGASFLDRERGHRTLAAVLEGSAEADRRAWHLAAATTGTDDDVAADLENTAERARRRGGYSGAATALERAAELTADTTARGRRLVAAAREAWHAGQPGRASALLDRAAPSITEEQLRAEADHVRGLIEWHCGSLLDAESMLIAGADRIAPTDPRKALEMLVDAGSIALKAGDFGAFAEIGRRTSALPRSEDELGALLSDVVVGVGGLFEGRTASATSIIVEAINRAGEFDDLRLLNWAAMGASAVGEEATQAVLLRRAVALARESVAVDMLILALELVVGAGGVAGRYTVDAEAAEGLRLAREAGLPNAANDHLSALAWIAALRGHDDQCLVYAAEVADRARTSGMASATSTAEWGVALLDLVRGRPDATVTRLVALRQAPIGIAHPFVVLVSTPDLVEACVRTGREEEARAAFAVLEAFAQPGAPSWALALAARCRALFSHGEDAGREFREALRLHAEADRPFDRARTELLFGEHLRRDRRRRESREHLRSAFETFDSLGATPWAERAGAELRASGETTRKRDPSAFAQLTPQELQIARLVSEGSSNREVAAQLFLSPRTVDYHLRKVFMKLGIASRAELIRDGVAALVGREQAAVAIT